MEREIDYEYEFQIDDCGTPIFPNGVTEDEDELYVLPNGKYLPPGCYSFEDGSLLIYEPHALGLFAEMLANCVEE